MSQSAWEQLRLPSNESQEEWEFFHENSKLSPYDAGISPELVRQRMGSLHESLPFDTFPAVDLPAARTPLTLSLDEALARRVTLREMEARPLPLANVASLLHSAYGISRSNEGTGFPRPFRNVPSAGALYPLELYVHSAHIEGVPAGIHHYNPTQGRLRRLQTGDFSRQISEALVQKELPFSSSLILFITSLFERTTFKYGARGYRFALLEAGHVAQNVSLAAVSLGLGAANLGGYFDRSIDALLGLDGVTHSTLYVVCIAAPASR